MSNQKISIILCTYNEADYIENTISKLQKTINNLEIIVVDDDSKDDTRVKIKNYPDLKNVKLIHRKKTRGLASAFLTGLISSNGDYVGWIDTNMSELVIRFIEMSDLLNSEYDIVILSRYVEGGGDNRVFFRSFCSKFFNLICRLLLGSKIKDYTSGIFLMKKKVLDEVTFLSYGHGEFFIEFIENAHRKGFKIKEIPYVQIKDDEPGSSKTAGNYMNFFYLGAVYFIRILKTIIRRN